MKWTAAQIARAAWTEIIEPGHSSSNKLIHAVGPERGLEIARGDGLTFDEKDRLQGWFTQDEFDRALHQWTVLAKGAVTNAERNLERLANMEGGRFLTPEDEDWPHQLDELDVPPIGLWSLGYKPLPELEKMVAVVGSRDATQYGQTVTNDMVGGLSDRGYTIVSGGAYGIDAHAHRAALNQVWMRGTTHLPTVAVLASGVNRFYPAGNADMLNHVATAGRVLSELPPGTAPTRYRFLRRNQIIAGLSAAVVVVEARWRSGALNTATHAKVLGRVLCAVPGSVHSANSMGCHRLIREGSAELVNDASEVAERLN